MKHGPGRVKAGSFESSTHSIDLFNLSFGDLAILGLAAIGYAVSSTLVLAVEAPVSMVFDTILLPIDMQLSKARQNELTLADSTATSPEVLTSLASSDSYKVRSKVAVNPSTPPQALKKLSQAPVPHAYLINVAKHPSTPSSSLSRLADLAEDENYVKRMIGASAAGNPNTPAETLARSNGFRRVEIQRALASNPSAPPEILDQLAKTTTFKNLYPLVAANPATSPDTLEYLVKHLPNNTDLAVQLARNPKTSNMILREIAKSNHRRAYWAIADNPVATREVIGLLIDIAVESDSLAARLARHKNISPKDLDTIARNTKETRVLRAIAGNSNTADETLQRLVGEWPSEQYLMMLISKHPEASNATLMQILQLLSKNRVRQFEYVILESVAEHPASSPQALKKVYEWCGHYIERFSGFNLPRLEAIQESTRQRLDPNERQ